MARHVAESKGFSPSVVENGIQWNPPARPPVNAHNVTKTRPTVTLAEFELLVMVAAMRLGAEDAHAVSIAADITDRTGRGVRRANVYMTLQRLEEKGLLTTGLGEARPERGGKPRRLVTPTRDGVEAVRATMAAITAMTRGVKI